MQPMLAEDVQDGTEILQVLGPRGIVDEDVIEEDEDAAS